MKSTKHLEQKRMRSVKIKLLTTLSLFSFAPLPDMIQSGAMTTQTVAAKEFLPSQRPVWNVESSVKLSPETITQAMKAARNAYSEVIAPYAKITMEKATKIAQSTLPDAHLKDISLQTIRQNLVYIALLDKANQRQLVIIDAGNGNILTTRSAHDRHEHRKPGRINLNF